MLLKKCVTLDTVQNWWYICVSLSCTEKGQFVALDLGGSKFKVLQVKVREGMGIRRGGVEMEEKIYPIPKELLSGRGTEVRTRGGGGHRRHGQGNQRRRWNSKRLPSASSLSLCSCLTMCQSLWRTSCTRRTSAWRRNILWPSLSLFPVNIPNWIR